MQDQRETSQKEKNDSRPQKPNFFQVLLSTAAAAFGVQSNKNRERDFKGGNVYTYIAAGVIFTTVFVLAVILVVRLVLAKSGL